MNPWIRKSCQSYPNYSDANGARDTAAPSGETRKVRIKRRANGTFDLVVWTRQPTEPAGGAQ
jgi:hypothetical protein